MKSVLISIQPYWVFLIIAKAMGWEIDKQKTIEVRKDYPKDENWDKTAIIYCSKDRKSFNLIPRKYQPFMERFLGKVVGEFVCDKIFNIYFAPQEESSGERYYLMETDNDPRSNKYIHYNHCLSFMQLERYLGCNKGYGWHILALKIYNKPKELSEFGNLCRKDCLRLGKGKSCDFLSMDGTPCNRIIPITRPPQSWCYVESLGE